MYSLLEWGDEHAPHERVLRRQSNHREPSHRQVALLFLVFQVNHQSKHGLSAYAEFR